MCEVSFIEIDRKEVIQKTAIPLFSHSVQTGFPSPAEDYVEGRLDLNKKLIKQPAAMFFVRIEGNSS